MEFKHRIALITGGARGIGGGIASHLAKASAKVIITDVLETVGTRLAESLTNNGCEARFQHLDVTSTADWESVCSNVQADEGRLDIVVNAAGILISGGIEETTFEQYRRVMAISADGTWLSLHHCLPLLKSRTANVPQAAVVNISSIAAFSGAASALSYAASRAAMLSMSKSAAIEWARKGYNIRVNSVHPGSVRTDLSNITYSELMKGGMTKDQAVAHMTKLHPLGRLGTVDDIAEAALYLASDRASWTTGSSLVVDGGRIA